MLLPTLPTSSASAAKPGMVHTTLLYFQVIILLTACLKKTHGQIEYDMF